MPVLLATSHTLPRGGYRHWASVGPPPAGLDPTRRLPDLAAQLEQAYDAIAGAWWTLGRRLAIDPSASLAHAPACAANISDLGLMLAWTRLVQEWVQDAATVLVVCDDPWLYRHLARLRVVAGGKPPRLLLVELHLLLRGHLARVRVSLRVLLAWARLRGQRNRCPKGAPALLVYGHPTSTAEGFDGYFGGLMAEVPALVRVLHVDCGPDRARMLAADGRTFSLHAWGSPLAALALPFVRWRSRAAREKGPLRWLVRRAERLEGGSGQAAMICWQQLCQRRWLDEARPRVVVWPWENHAWERAFVGAARAGGVRTLGYQHATVGAREWNHSPASDPADEGSLPDRILCTGEAGRAALLAFGVPAGRLAIGGALRLKTFGPLRRDPAGPVFVALPFDAAIAAQMVDACRRLADKGWRFVVKDHPMTPFAFAGGENMVRADRSLADQPAVSAVLYAATTVGLEAILGGLPTLRFVPEGKVPNDPVPAALAVPAVSAATLQAALHDLRVPPPPAGAAVFAPPDLDLWRSELA